MLMLWVPPQNKKRRYDNDRERTPEEPPEDPLRDATTLYVGNLFVETIKGCSQLWLICCRSFFTTEEQIHELFAKYATQPQFLLMR